MKRVRIKMLPIGFPIGSAHLTDHRRFAAVSCRGREDRQWVEDTGDIGSYLNQVDLVHLSQTASSLGSCSWPNSFCQWIAEPRNFPSGTQIRLSLVQGAARKGCGSCSSCLRTASGSWHPSQCRWRMLLCLYCRLSTEGTPIPKK